MDQTPIQRLQSGDVPRMVGWYEPRLLAARRRAHDHLVGVRPVRRPAPDPGRRPTSRRSTTIVNRYDYSRLRSEDPERRVARRRERRLLGRLHRRHRRRLRAHLHDGLPARAGHLDVEGTGRLPHGEILIMGGDQCYPQATREEYKKRLQMPFDWAFTMSQSRAQAVRDPRQSRLVRRPFRLRQPVLLGARPHVPAATATRSAAGSASSTAATGRSSCPTTGGSGAPTSSSRSTSTSRRSTTSRPIAGLMGRGDNLIICIAEPTWMIAESAGPRRGRATSSRSRRSRAATASRSAP